MMHDDPSFLACLHAAHSGFVPARRDGRVLGLLLDSWTGLADLAPPADSTMVQWWAGPAASLRAGGYDTRLSCDDLADGGFSRVLLRAPKQMTEMQFLLAMAWGALRPGGDLIAFAANDSGGQRIAPLLKDAGLSLESLSKNKSRVVRAIKNDAGHIPHAWRDGGSIRRHPDTGFHTCPGLFSWDRVDRASAMLRDHLPTGLSGAGADLGCGYGFLSRAVLASCPGVAHVTGLDADARAVDAAVRNMAGDSARFSARHCDVPAGTGLRDLDFIVMNPPFHTGTRETRDLGRAFIARAREGLRPGGVLWMVSNAHLGYDDDLARLFSATDRVHGGDGFRIDRAVA